MTILVFRAPNHAPQEFPISDHDIRIGTAPGDTENSIVLPNHLDIAPLHAVISRSEHYGTSVLINLAEEPAITRVNRQPVVKLRTLRHRDRIQLGQAELEFWEMTAQRLEADARQIGQTCPVCFNEFAPGESMIVCPRCESPYHKNCWFISEVCGAYGCEYPIQKSIQRALATRIRFEKLESTAELVKQSQKCSAGNPIDRVPFQAGEIVAHCPECHTPFHSVCFFGLQNCSSCNFDVAHLMQSVFDPKSTLHIVFIFR